MKAFKQEENSPVLGIIHPLIFITFDAAGADGGQNKPHIVFWHFWLQTTEAHWNYFK